MRLLPEERIERDAISRAQRRQEWKETVIQIARSHGDERAGDVILREASAKAGRIKQAFNESYKDRDNAETVSQGTYSLFNSKGQEVLMIERGTILVQSLRFADPVVKAG
jgi:hypothetical protein